MGSCLDRWLNGDTEKGENVGKLVWCFSDRSIILLSKHLSVSLGCEAVDTVVISYLLPSRSLWLVSRS